MAIALQLKPARFFWQLPLAKVVWKGLNKDSWHPAHERTADNPPCTKSRGHAMRLIGLPPERYPSRCPQREAKRCKSVSSETHFLTRGLLYNLQQDPICLHLFRLYLQVSPGPKSLRCLTKSSVAPKSTRHPWPKILQEVLGSIFDCISTTDLKL